MMNKRKSNAKERKIMNNLALTQDCKTKYEKQNGKKSQKTDEKERMKERIRYIDYNLTGLIQKNVRP